MGLLDTIKQKLGSGSGGSGGSSGSGGPGGSGGSGLDLPGLTQKLSQGGLGDQVQSWLGQGENRPVTGQQISQALGDDHVRQLAGKAGVSPDQMSEQLAKDLPQAVDKASPSGQLS
ncbi:MAG: DUF937 domain-containing protein [Actinobacteria bacterium]|nr:DUF937 domain-containing protein [Actinomycetota bacterium]